MKKNIAIVGLNNGKEFAKKIAAKLKVKTSPYTYRKFPDNEQYVKFDFDLKGKVVVLVQSLSVQPNNAILELFFAGRNAKKMQAKKVIAVTPYLAYMRQDAVFNFGESFSAKEIGWLFSHCVDELMAFDPHLHRIPALSKIFSIKTKKLTATTSIGKFVLKKFLKEKTVLVGPDKESSQWAKKIADSIGFDSTILGKKRLGDRKVKVQFLEKIECKNKTVVIIDDIVSTGTTIIQAVKEIKKRKPKSIYCICVHPLLVEGALNKIKKAGVREVISCNTIPSKTNKIDLSEVVTEALK